MQWGEAPPHFLGALWGAAAPSPWSFLQPRPPLLTDASLWLSGNKDTVAPSAWSGTERQLLRTFRARAWLVPGRGAAGSEGAGAPDSSCFQGGWVRALDPGSCHGDFEKALGVSGHLGDCSRTSLSFGLVLMDSEQTALQRMEAPLLSDWAAAGVEGSRGSPVGGRAQPARPGSSAWKPWQPCPGAGSRGVGDRAHPGPQVLLGPMGQPA